MLPGCHPCSCSPSLLRFDLEVARASPSSHFHALPVHALRQVYGPRARDILKKSYVGAPRVRDILNKTHVGGPRAQDILNKSVIGPTWLALIIRILSMIVHMGV